MRSYSATRQLPSLRLYDKWFVIAVVSIILFGLLMMASASIVISDKQMEQPFFYLYKQAVYLGIGFFLGGAVLQIEMQYWEKYGSLLLLAGILMLMLVFVPGIGHRVNGSARWIGYGSLTFQVSELVKLIVVLYMAGYLIRRHDEIRSRFSGFLKPMMILIIISFLLLLEPDFGATVVVMTTALGMMFLAGMQLRHFIVLLSLAASSLAVLAVSAPYRLARLTSFLNPWERPFDTGYQLTQSLIAFGRGGWFGLGLGKSIQKMFYLPEAHTDFLFAVIVEELGILGAFTIIALFLLLTTRMFMIGREAQRLGKHFAGLAAYGFALWVAIQFTVSIGVNSGILPTKGLTLPLMSYGGSSLLVNCMMIAIMLRINYENRMTSLGIK